MWCEGNGWPCSEESLTTQPLCPYHYKLSVGLLADSQGRYHATPPDRPELERDSDGWLSLSVPEDPIEQLLGWDEKRLRALEGFR